MRTLQEPARRIPIVDSFDVLVLGGGIAGVAAAIAAARNSARVCLIERYCALGGLPPAQITLLLVPAVVPRADRMKLCDLRVMRAQAVVSSMHSRGWLANNRNP